MTECDGVVSPKSLEPWDYVTKASAETMISTCGVSIAPSAEDGDAAGEDMMVAIISLVGEVDWSVSLGLPRETATGLAASFAGFEISFEDPEMSDAVGELANILGGQVKSLLSRQGVKANISLPTVMSGRGLDILAQPGALAKKACFDSAAGRLWVGMSVGKRTAKRTSLRPADQREPAEGSAERPT